MKRRAIVSELYLAGKTQYQISLVVHVTPQQVSSDLKRIREQWRANSLHNYDEKVDLELANADQVEHEAWKAWGESIGKHTVVTEREGKDGMETITRTAMLFGDPRFLMTILKCIDIRCRILGLYAPTNKRVSNNSPVTVELIMERSLKVETMKLLTENSDGGGSD